MIKYRISDAVIPLLPLFLLFISIGTTLAQSSQNYQLKKSVFDQSGAASQSTNHIVVDAVGQPSHVGKISNTNYTVSSGYFGGDVITHTTVTELGEAVVPQDFKLCQNYPNPFNPETMIRFDVKEPCHVVLKVFDLLGREIIKLVDESYQAGQYQIKFDASTLSCGLYLYRIQMENYTAVRKMMLLK